MKWLKKFFKKSKTSISIYTDGSLKKNKGAWAFRILQNEQVLRESSGRELNTTSLRMELKAAIEALKTLPPETEAVLYSDSSILVKTATKDMDTWAKNGWTKSRDRQIPDLDLIQELFNLNQKHKIEWKWVKAHSGIIHNERCDELCVLARDAR